MEPRKLGQSDVAVPAITLGAWAIGGWMWGGQEHQTAVDAIRAALDSGVFAIDTAPVYGFGRSEEIVGEVIRDVPRQDVVILTKFGLRWDIEAQGERYFETTELNGKPTWVYKYAAPESVKLECDRSLKRLGTDYIDIFQIHWPDGTTPIEDTFGAVAELIAAGKVRAAGVSNYSPEQMARAQRVCPIASSQPPFSMARTNSEQDVIPWCRENHVGVVVYSPLERGLLTGKITEGHTFPEGDHRASNPYFRPGNVRRVNAMLEQIRPVAEAHNATLAQLVLAWTIRRPGITAALVGARNREQATANAAAMNVDLTAGEVRQIDGLVAGLELEI